MFNFSSGLQQNPERFTAQRHKLPAEKPEFHSMICRISTYLGFEEKVLRQWKKGVAVFRYVS